MKKDQRKQGSALIITILLLALMLTLVLYYVSLVRLETQVSGFSTARSLSREALDRALSEAASELEGRHSSRAALGRTTLDPSDLPLLVSKGSGGALTEALTLAEVEALGWPDPQRLVNLLDDAEWVLVGASNARHQAYAWAMMPLTGLLDPQGVEGWSTDHLGYTQLEGMEEEVFFSAEEFYKQYPAASIAFLPGNYSVDRGWYDFETSTWQTNTTVGAELVSLNPLEWTEAETLAVFEELYPDRDFAGLAAAFMDFKQGREVPLDEGAGLSAVPIPMFNEINARMTVSNLGSSVVISHKFDLEVWYPFPGNPNPHTYRVAQTPALVARSAGSSAAELIARDSDAEWTFEAPSGGVESAFGVLTMTQTSSHTSFTEGQILELDWDLAGVEIEQLDQGIVDRFPAGYRLFMPSLTIPPSGGVEQVDLFVEVQDPSLNFRADVWLTASNQSLFSINQAARDVFANDSADRAVKWTPAGRAGEWQEGWAGFIPLDEPWQTVDLFSEAGQWWLMHTRRPDWEPGKWSRSRVNPNSTFADTLATVFLDLPKREWPGAPSTNFVNFAEAQAMAMDLTAGYLLEDSFNSDQRGEWTEALASVLTADNADRHQAESVISESLDRLDVGYQLYGLWLGSETRLPNGRTQSRQRQFVLFWVDPYPNSDGRHSTMVLLRSNLR